MLVIISSPSGGGKDTVIRELLKIFPRSCRLITTTSRPPRPGNKDGVDYFFVSREEFERGIGEGFFLENNIYAGNFYGTNKARLDEALAKHDIVFSQIEVNGKHNLDKAGVKNLAIFLLPENLDILKNRVMRRGGLDEKTIEKRMEIARKEIEESADYDYQIVNKEGKLEETIAEVAKIIKAALADTGIDNQAKIS